ncbi:WSC domain-containing protein [Botrytis cinerea]
MILSNLFIASLGIISVTSSQSFSAINVCLDALSSEPNNAKDFCIQFLVSSTIPIPSFASPCLGTDPSDNQLFKSCYEVLHQFEKEVPLPELSHLGLVDEPVKRGETLPRDGGFFSTESVLSVTTNVGTYDNFGCFEDGTRGKPLGSPLLNLTGPAADTIQSCVNACSISGQNGIPYRYAGIEPGSCWCSNYISILSVKTASFCQSTCPSNYGKYCGGIVGGVLHMQIYELKKMNPTSTTSAKTTFTSSLKSSVKSSISASQSGTTSSSKLLSLTTQTSSQKSSSISKSTSSSSTRFTSSISSVPGFSTTSKIPIISLSTIIESSTTTKSFGLPPDPPTILPIVGPTGTESYILPPGTFAYPSELPTLTQSFGLPPDPPTIPPIAGPTGTESYILPSGTFAYPSRASTTANPNPWASLTLEEPEFWTQVPSGAVPGYVEPTTTLQPISTATSPSQKSKREYDITAPDSPWLPLLPLTSPEILKEVLPGQVPGWDQHAIAKHKKLKSREYDINAPDSPWFPLLPLTSPEILKEVAPDQVPGWKQQAIVSRSDRTKREYDVKAPTVPGYPSFHLPPQKSSKKLPPIKFRSLATHPSPLHPLHPQIRSRRPSSRLAGQSFRSSHPQLRYSSKTQTENQTSPPARASPRKLPRTSGRPDFIKAYPEKDNNKPLPPPFNKMLNAVDPTTGTKFPTLKTKPRYSHSKISLKEFPSLEEIGLGQDGREHHHKEDDEDTEEAKRISDLQKIRDRRYAHKLHLQGTPKAYAELAEKTERRARKGRKKMDMEDWEKRIFMAVGSQRKGEEVDPLLRDDVIIDRVLLGEDERDGEGEDGEAENWIWRTWSGGEGKRKGRKIRLER